MLENTNFEHYRHVDMWLVDLLKKQKARGFLLLPVLAGYGHRVSMSESELGEQKFGGCFLPQKPNARPMRQDDKENYIYRYAPPGIRDWVEACRCELGRPPKRKDVVKAILMLEIPDAKAYIDFGLYKKQDPADVLGQEAAGYELKIEVPLPSSYETDFHRPPEPRTMSHIGTDLEKLWEVFIAREKRGESEFPPLSRSEIQLACWKYRAATVAVKGNEEAKLPLSPEWQHFARLCRNEAVAREGLDLAVFLSQGPWTFDVRLVVPTWVETQIWWDDFAGSAQDRQEIMQSCLLFIYSRILPDLKEFLRAVDLQEQPRRAKRRTEETENSTDQSVSTPPELTVPRRRLERAKVTWTIASGRKL